MKIALFMMAVLVCMRLQSFAQTPQGFANDSKLNNKVSVDYICTDLKTICRQLSTNSILIKAHPDCQDVKIQCRLNQRTQAQIMGVLAEWLPGNWEKLPNETGYILIRTPKASKQMKEWWETFLRVREQAYKAQTEELIKVMSTPPPQRPANGTPPKNDAGDGLPPLPDPNEEQALFHSLPEPVVRQLLQKHINYADYQKESGGTFSQDQVPSLTVPLPDVTRTALRGYGKNFPNDAQLRLRYIGTNVHALIFGEVSSHPLASATLGPTQPKWFYFAPRPDDSIVAFSANVQDELPKDVKTLIALSKRTVWKNAQPKSSNATQPLSLLQMLTRAAALAKLTNAPNVEYLADYYSSFGNDENVPPVRNRPPSEEEWNQFALQYDSSLKRNEDVVLVRSNRWYRDDKLEVPHELAKQWMQKRDQRKGEGLRAPRDIISDACEFARSLTLWQAANGLKWLSRREMASTPKEWQTLLGQTVRTGPPLFLMDSMWLIRLYDIVSFCNSLSEEARTALLDKRLMFSSLTAPQRDALLKLIPELQQNGVRQITLGVDMVGNILPAPGIKVFSH
jgi:hypothetical protein